MNSVQVLADTALVDMPQVLYADGRDSVVVRAKDNISVLLPDSCDTSGITLTVQYDSEAPLEAPLEAETKVGTVSAVLDGKVLATCDLVTLTAVMRSTPKYVAKQTESVLAKIWKGMWRLWFVTVPVLLALVFWLIVAILRSINRRRAKSAPCARAVREPVRAGRTAVDELNVLRMSCEGCTGCGLAATRHSVVFGVGPCPSPVVFIGEGPGQQEDLRGEPFVGPAGQLLDDMLSIIDLGRHNCYTATSSNAARPETAIRSRRSRMPALAGSSGSSGCCSRASSSASGALRPCGSSGRISASRGSMASGSSGTACAILPCIIPPLCCGTRRAARRHTRTC